MQIVADDSLSGDYGLAKHLAAVERAYAEGLAHIAAQAEAWTAAPPADTPVTGQMVAMTGRPFGSDLPGRLSPCRNGIAAVT
jgi:hypothetical protein